MAASPGHTGAQRSNWHPALLASVLRSNRLTLLSCESGASRDAMLRRGLMPLLQPLRSDAGECALRFDNWGVLPLQALREQIDRALPAPPSQTPSATLKDQLIAAARRHRMRVLLVLDAFERHLREPAGRADIARLDTELASCIVDPEVPLHVMLVVDDATHPALHRYRQWIPDFGHDWLRLSNAPPHDDAQWSDTDIELRADDVEAPPHEGDWLLDLPLDEPAAALASASPDSRDAVLGFVPGARDPEAVDPPVHGAAADQADRRATEVRDADVPSDTPAAPPHAAEQLHAAAPVHAPPAQPDAAAAQAPVAAARADTAAHAAAPHAPWPPAPSPPHAWPPASPRAAWPPPGTAPHTAAQAPRASNLPPWHAEADARFAPADQRPTRWWQSPLRLGTDLAALAAAMWLVATWIIGDDHPPLRTSVPSTAAPSPNGAVERAPEPVVPRPPPAPSPQAMPPVPSTQATPPQATPPAPAPQATPPAPSPQAMPPAQPPEAMPPAPVPAPTAAPAQPMTLAMPIDGGTAAAAIDELMRLVATPANIPMTVVAPDAAATLAIWRHDALVDARATNARPLRVLAPLLREQIQVIVRNDAPWDYLREIKGLRLNIGRSDGARARTARTLYRQMFGEPLPAASTDDLDEGAALQRLLRRGGPIDAMIVVSEVPLLNRLPSVSRDQLRELPFDPNDPRTAGALQAFSLQRLVPREKPRLTVTSFLVTGPPPHPNESTLRQLAVALCRAQPALQAKDASLLRGFAQGEQPPAPWPYVLPREGSSGCPTLPAATDSRRDGARVPARAGERPRSS